MRYQGKITEWKDDQGFGFVTPNGGGKKVFVHINSFANRQRRPVGNEIVTYAVSTDAQGRLQADDVLFVGEKKLTRTTSGSGNASLLFTLIFFGCLFCLVLVEAISMELFLFYLVISTLTLIAYAWDKSAAQNANWRMKENTLHLLSLVGGWPGALIAQRYLRHKSRKQPFQLIFWVTVILNVAVLSWFNIEPTKLFFSHL